MKNPRGIYFAIVAVAVIALGSAWALSNGDTIPEKQIAAAPSPTPTPVIKADKGIQHIHHLMLTDKELLIGSHQGLWSQMPGEPAKRIGDSTFDVMGLSAMEGALVASGHPGEGEVDVGNLGFQKSIDGGLTWESISLRGDIDFHRLVASGNVVMGSSAGDGALMRSEDSGRTWSNLPNPGLYDLVMDPANSKVVIGTTENGPLISVNGGKSFSPITNAPLLALVSWDTSRLAGVAPTGEVYQSLDAGSTWKKLATVPGDPMAISVKGEQIAILAGTTVYYSTDAGNTFSARIVEVNGH